MQDWIKLYRQLRDTPFYTESKAVHIWVECLLRAQYSNRECYLKRKKLSLKAGQFVMGRDEFGRKIGISGSTVRYWMTRFEADSMVDIKKTYKGSIVTIRKWSNYQGTDSKPATRKTREKQEKNTYKKDKKEKKDKNKDIKTLAAAGAAPHDDIVQVFERFSQQINPTINYGNKTNRKAAEYLIKKYGLNVVMDMVTFLEKIHGEQYAPMVTTPHQLREKMGALIAYTKRNNKSSKSNVVSI